MDDNQIINRIKLLFPNYNIGLKYIDELQKSISFCTDRLAGLNIIEII